MVEEANIKSKAYTTPGEDEEIILERIQSQVPQWAHVRTIAEVSFQRLNGLSNACYRVELEDSVPLADEQYRVLLYRKFENEVVDLAIEKLLFSSMAESNLGPALIY